MQAETEREEESRVRASQKMEAGGWGQDVWGQGESGCLGGTGCEAEG